MKLLCTADFHLQTGNQEKLSTLKWLYEEASRQEVDAFLLAGDLFDTRGDYNQLKSKVINIFDGVSADIPVLAVPGNHDNFLKNTIHLGEDVHILDESNPSRMIEDRGQKVQIIGLPYLKGQLASQYIDSLHLQKSAEAHFLISHGSLIDPDHEYLQKGIEAQSENNSFLFFPEDFNGSGIAMTILGHWHGNKVIHENDLDFLYPGSPLPNSSRELGQKSYTLVQIDSTGESRFRHNLIRSPDSWYYRKESLFVRNLKRVKPKLSKILEGNPADSRCFLILEVEGFVPDEQERRIKREIQRQIHNHQEDFFDIRLKWKVGTTTALENPLIQRYLDRAENLEPEDIDISDILSSDESDLRERFMSLLSSDFEAVIRKIEEHGLSAFSNRLD